jgi:putative DNA methylase
VTSAPRPSASRPRVIERWFPCAEVSAASGSGWGSSNSETLLMSWFAKRPLAQSRAAVLCSLLPWPEDPAEQERVQAILREALGVCQDPSWYACGVDSCEKLDCSKKAHMQQANRPHEHGIVDCAKLDPTGGYDAARTDVLKLLKDAYPDRPAEMLDPFSGRGLIPLEAARYGQQAHAIDYSPVATLASRLLIDWPFRDWSDEPQLPFDPPGDQVEAFDPSDPQRLIRDIATVHAEVQRRIEKELDEFYPDNEHGEKPWGYLWAQVIPCDGCGQPFPLYASNRLQLPNSKTGEKGSSFELLPQEGDRVAVRVVEGWTDEQPTMRARPGGTGKLAWCPRSSCGHAHTRPEHQRLSATHLPSVALLVVADIVGKRKLFRPPTEDDLLAAERAAAELTNAPPIAGLSRRPAELIEPGVNATSVQASVYGARTFGDMSVDRQNLLLATTSAAIADAATAMRDAGCSSEYAAAISGYCAATLARKLKRSTRGARLQTAGGAQVGDIFVNESSIAFNYDFFETGIGRGPGTWLSVSVTPSALSRIAATRGAPAYVARGSALKIHLRTGSMDAVVTDPPYEAMISYSDVSDLYWVWIRRALAEINPDFAMTSNSNGVQEKAEEIIVKKDYTLGANEHRTPEFYRINIARAFAECRRAVHDDGVVSIVFGHGDPDAWRALLDAVSEAGLVPTGAWPANTEKGGSAGSANIQTTLTLACRPAPADRPDGRVAEVDAEMRQVIAERVRTVWNPSGLSYVDQKMAAAGPALEVVGRYGRILDKRGQPVDLTRYLPLARQAVTEAHNLSFDSLPLDTFDQKTRFALEWVRSFGRKIQAASEARWQRLAADLEEADTAGVLTQVDKGVRLAYAKEAKVEPVEGLSLFEVALAAAAAWRDGTLADSAAVIRTCKVEPDDPHFWACLRALSQNLPETDKDGAVWTSMVRNRDALAAGISNAEAAAQAVVDREKEAAKTAELNPALFEDPNSLFGQEVN